MVLTLSHHLSYQCQIPLPKPGLAPLPSTPYLLGIYIYGIYIWSIWVIGRSYDSSQFLWQKSSLAGHETPGRRVAIGS